MGERHLRYDRVRRIHHRCCQKLGASVVKKVPMPAHEIHVDAPVPRPPGIPAPDQITNITQIVLNEHLRRDGLDQAGVEFLVNVLIVDDAEIADVNAEHRGKPRPTDVLSFPMLEFPNGPGTSAVAGDVAAFREITAAFPAPGGVVQLGDVLISHETCARQAAEIGHGVRDEFLRLLVHGLLHLFGYDHETNAADEQRMRAREDELHALID